MYVSIIYAFSHLLLTTTTPPFQVLARARSMKPGHCVTLIYTSGTTGPPKARAVHMYLLCVYHILTFISINSKTIIRHVQFICIFMCMYLFLFLNPKTIIKANDVGMHDTHHPSHATHQHGCMLLIYTIPHPQNTNTNGNDRR